MGWPELAVVMIVAVFVFGPDKLPVLAKQAGSFLRTARQMVNNAKGDLSKELGDEYAVLKDMSLRDLNPKEFVRRQVVEAMEAEPEEPKPRGSRPLRPGEHPPFDVDAT
ncbi:MAG: sec-independent translocase [Actinomycetota bacterium]|nr:sec-independent translocase [Actinomycetota bacterium]